MVSEDSPQLGLIFHRIRGLSQRLDTLGERLDAVEHRRGTAQEKYRRWRPPVERAIAWLVARGNHRVPYRGITKNNTWLHHRAAALNLRRLVNLGLTRTRDGNWALA